MKDENLTAEMHRLLSTRDSLWDSHPIIEASAVLPTPPIKWAQTLVKSCGRRHRSSLAFWAHPMTGKTSCIRSLEVLLHTWYPGCGILIYEGKTKTSVIAEGAFLEDILKTMDYEPRIQHSLAGKRDQMKNALYALSAVGRHLFVLIDEAQELKEAELCWLKEALNWINLKHKFKVAVILFGQQELLNLQTELIGKGRSDLHIRYTSRLLEFETIRKAADLILPFKACDVGSEYPAGSGWSYTRFLWPRAFDAGVMRLEEQTETAWSALLKASPTTGGMHGIGMQWIASVLAGLADATKDRDGRLLTLTEQDWLDAIEMSDYIDQPPTKLKTKRPDNGRKGDAA